MATEDVGQKDAVIIHPTGSIAIIRKRDYDLLLSDQRRAHKLARQVAEQKQQIAALNAEIDALKRNCPDV